MEKVYEISLLLDFYGQLLTARQQEILDLHYNNDLSLGEIAENLEISRQGVFDNIKRAKALLMEMEEKLGLVRKFSRQQEKCKELLGQLKAVDTGGMSRESRERLEAVENGIHEMIDGF